VKPIGISRNDSSWRQILLHTLNKSKQLSVSGAADLRKIFGYVASFHATFTFSHLDINNRCVDLKATKPERFCDDCLLQSLSQQSDQDAGSARFAEVVQHIQRGCFLDATVELFTPFVGIIPRFCPSGEVVFNSEHSRSKKVVDYLEDVHIWCADYFYPYIQALKTCVLVSGLHSSEDEEKMKRTWEKMTTPMSRDGFRPGYSTTGMRYLRNWISG
jgi:hypothetical protein